MLYGYLMPVDSSVCDPIMSLGDLGDTGVRTNFGDFGEGRVDAVLELGTFTLPTLSGGRLEDGELVELAASGSAAGAVSAIVF